MERIKLVVVNENTLGYIRPEQKDRYYILHASILKGAAFSLHPCDLLKPKTDKIRLATPKDFKEFRVSMKGFDNEKFYEYEK